MGTDSEALAARWSAFSTCPEAIAWLQVQADLGLAPRTIEAYARGLADYLGVCQREGSDPLVAGRAEIARYVRDLAVRPNHRGPNVIAFDSGVGLANATLQRAMAVHPAQQRQRPAFQRMPLQHDIDRRLKAIEVGSVALVRSILFVRFSRARSASGTTTH